MSSSDQLTEPGDRTERFGVAIIGMAGRFPKARTVREFWARLCAGEECLSRYRTEELVAAGIDRSLVERPDYVKVWGEVADADKFDAPFFGIPPREAELADPQHRLLLECAWEALEDAGYDPGRPPPTTGVFAGKALDSYLLRNVLPEFGPALTAGTLVAAIGNDKDSLTTLIAYHLDLRGPAITVQTSSSTSLVAVCVACQSLLTYQCDLALAGGVSLGSPIRCGYLAEEGGITSHDGHCRAFDARSSGYVPGNGLGLVVLKRLEDALSDGDHVYAVIRGFAVGNDGKKKVSYTAPSVDAHAEVIREARRLAGVAAADITYLEAHGTGTRLGDSVELAAFKRSYAGEEVRSGSCAIGSVKTNIGHLDTAAGVAGLIKAALAVYHGLIPASLHFETPNPELDPHSSPFYVNTELRTWRPECGIRRAGVSSLGMGGTNAHVVVEEAPRAPPRPESSRRYHVFVSAARTGPVLARNVERLSEFLGHAGSAAVQDVGYTLCRGRRAFRHRAAVVAENLEEASASLASLLPDVAGVPGHEGLRPLCFLFAGQGGQHPRMALDLYRHEPVFTRAFDTCAEGFVEHMGADLRDLLYAEAAADEERLADPRLCHPALFSVEYALAELWRTWGVSPSALIGHSLGEWVAATVGGLFSLDDALRLVWARAQLMYEAEPGSMVAVELPCHRVEACLDDEVCLAAVNAPELCVLSGPRERIERLATELQEGGVETHLLRVSHAFHSKSMSTVAERLQDCFEGVAFGELRVPLFSTALGRELRTEEAADPAYWCQQILLPVRFAEAVQEVASRKDCDFLEVGPGQTLTTLVSSILDASVGSRLILASLPGPRQSVPDDRFALTSLADLWVGGHDVEWEAIYPAVQHRRTPLPTYSFERIRYWVESPGERGTPAEPQVDQARLAATRPRKSRPPLTSDYAAPESEPQQQLIQIFEDLLGIRGIGVDDDLFELGGHSLMVTLLASRVREVFGVEMAVESIFEAANVRALSTRLQGAVVSEALVERLLEESLDEGKR